MLPNFKPELSNEPDEITQFITDKAFLRLLVDTAFSSKKMLKVKIQDYKIPKVLVYSIGDFVFRNFDEISVIETALDYGSAVWVVR